MKKRNWMSWIVATLIVLMGIASVYAASNPIMTGRSQPGSGWILVVADDDLATSVAGNELLTELDSTFVQIAAADTVYFVSSDNNDTTQTAYIRGIDNATGNQTDESITLTGTTIATSSTTFRYIDQIWLSAEAAGTVSLHRTDSPYALCNSIEIGSLKGDVGHHFNGEKVTYLKKWWATSNTTTMKNLELRWYPDDADCLDSDDGFTVLDRIVLAGTVYRCDPHVFGDSDDGLKLSAGGWLAIFGDGIGSGQEATVTVIGQDRRR